MRKWSVVSGGALALGLAMAISSLGAFYQKDAQTYFYPDKISWREQVWAGHLPLWQPLLELGAPFLADPSHGACYPFNVLVLLPVPLGITLMLLLHLLLAGLGATLLSRSLGASRPAAAVAGTGFGLGGFLASMTWNGTYLLGLSWMPLIVYTAIRAARTPSLRNVMALGLASGTQLLSGDVQASAMTWIFAAVVVTSGIRSTEGPKWRGFLAATAGLGLGMVTALPQILPAISHLAASTRAEGLPLDQAQLWSLHPWRLVELACAWFYGDASRRDLYMGLFLDDPTGRLSPWAATLYMGSLPIILALTALGWRNLVRAPSLLAVVGVGLLALLLSLGVHGPFYETMYSLLPGVALVRYPIKWFPLFGLCLCLLAARGLDSWYESRSIRPVAAILGLGALLLGASLGAPDIGAWLAAQRPALSSQTASWLVTSAVLLEGSVLIFSGLLLELCRRQSPALLRSVGCALVIGQLLLFNLRILSPGPTDLYREPPPLAQALTADSSLSPGRLPRLINPRQTPPSYLDCLGSFAPVEEAQWLKRALVTNSGVAFGIGYVRSYGALPLATVESFWQQCSSLGRPIYDLFAVGYALVPLRSEAADLKAQRLEPLATDCLTLVRSLTASPFAYVSPSYLRRPAKLTLPEALSLPKVLSRTAALLESDFLPRFTAKAEPYETGPASPSSCSATRKSPTELSLECSGPGMAVINETHHPGWRARLDGRPAQVTLVNGLVMGVEIEAGTHRVELEYTEPMFFIGLSLSLGVWLCVLLGLGLAKHRRRISPALTCLLTIFLVAGCSTPPAEGNIILVTVDTLRPDHVGPRPVGQSLTPGIDAFFAKGTTATHAFSPSPCTLPAVKQILTGVFWPTLNDERIADVLHRNGYETAAFVSHYIFGEPGRYSLHYARGFDVFDVQTKQELGPDNLSTRSAKTVVERALLYLKQRDPSRPLFLWLHLFDPHDPYAPPISGLSTLPEVKGAVHAEARTGDVRATLRAVTGNPNLGQDQNDTNWMLAAPHMPAQDVRALRRLYEKEVAFTDAALGPLWRFLDKTGLTGRSTVALTADHGEQLGEDGAWLHCLSLQERELRVPLLIRAKGTTVRPGLSRIEAPVSTLDVAPTLLSSVGKTVNHPQRLDGRSWVSTTPGDPVLSHWGQTYVARDASGTLYWTAGTPIPDNHASLWHTINLMHQKSPPDAQAMPLEPLRALGYIQ